MPRVDQRHTMLVGAALGITLALSTAHAQDAAPVQPAPQAAPASSAPAPAAPTKPKKPVKGLDDLLGLPAQKPAAPPEGEPAPAGPDAPPGEVPLDDPAALELERKLSDQEIADRFRDAVRQMGESADRIAKGGDVGLVTQRLQEEILKKLDLLVKQGESQSGSSSSSSSSGQQQASAQADPGRQQGKQSQSQKGQQNQAGEGENRGEAMPPPGQDPRFKGRLDTARAAWGNLPERVRESLLQGSGDYFSSLYEALTESYYRKLAEEGQAP